MAVSRLRLRLLGSPQVESDGAPVITDTRKATALLAYLAVGAQAHTRDALATLLWPDLGQTRARAALRRTLSALHAACAADWLLAEREQVALARERVWCDVAEFRALLDACRTHGHPAGQACGRCVPLLEQAAALYRDDFLAGFSLRDSVSFDDWQFFQAEGLRRDFAHALERLVECYTRRCEWAQGTATARRWLALDPLHEPAHRQLMLLYAWSGERAAALRQYQICEDILARELDVGPQPETTELFLAIKERREPPRPPAPEEPAAPTAATTAPPETPAAAPAGGRVYPLVGRATELEQARRTYAAARAGGRLIVLEGEPGIGKTRLAETLAAEARAQGARVLAARAYAGEQSIAYGAIVELLRAGLAQPGAAVGATAAALLPWRAEVARLLPEQGDAPAADIPPAGDAGAQARLFEALLRTLLALVDGPAPGLILLDDFQWADSASLDFLAYLVHRLPQHRLCAVVAWRSDDAPSPFAAGRLRQMIAEAQRRHYAAVIVLQRLSAGDVGALLDAVGTPDTAGALDRAQRRALAARLMAEAEGLPFFVVEYLESLAADGHGPASDWPIPAGVRDLLRARLGAVDDMGRQLLAAAAVVGRSFDFTTLRTASGRSEEETLDAVEGLLARGLIREVAGETFDFSHTQLRALVYEETSLTRRRLLHRRVAEAIQTQARLHGADTESVAATLAYHFQHAGQAAEAARYHFLAGERAAAVYANRDALEHLLNALALGYPGLAALHSRLGDLYTLLGDYPHAIESYDRAAALLPPAEVADVAQRAGRAHHRLGRWEQAAQHFHTALELLPQNDGGRRSRVLADWSLTAARRGDAARAADLAQQALDQATAAGDRRALAQAHGLLSILARNAGEGERAVQHGRAGLALAEEIGDPAALVATLNSLALALSAQGDQGGAAALLQRALDLCVYLGDRHSEAALRNNLADVYHAAGQGEQAMAQLKEAVAIFAEIGEMGAGLSDAAEIWKLVEW